jgi:putative flippase GtrA
MTVGAAYLLTILLLYIFISKFGFHDLLAKVFVTIIVLFWNFSVNKFWVFKSKQEVVV